jgi:hypothetical protein
VNQLYTSASIFTGGIHYLTVTTAPVAVSEPGSLSALAFMAAMLLARRRMARTR